MGVSGQRHAPAALPPGKEIRYPLYRRLGGPQVRSERVQKISPPQRCDPRTIQPVASRYTDYAIPTHIKCSRTDRNSFTSVSKAWLTLRQFSRKSIRKYTFKTTKMDIGPVSVLCYKAAEISN